MRNPRRRRFISFGRLRGSRQVLDTEHPKFMGATTVAAGAAVAMPANASLARVLAAHVVRDGELVLLVLRPSFWFVLLRSLRFVAGAGVLICVVRWHSLAEHGMVRSLIELGVTAISARLMWATLQWMSRLYVLTDQRILSVSGVFYVNVFDCPLRKVARTRLIRNPSDKLTGVGSIEIIPLDDEKPFGDWQTIAQPIAVHEKILATISRAKQGGMLCD
jgi:hypothetical protein